MPSYRVGGGVEGAATTLLEHVQSQNKRRQEEEDNFRKFQLELQKAVLTREDVSPQYLEAMLGGKDTTGIAPIQSDYVSKKDLQQRRGELLDTTRIRQEFINRPEVKEYQTIDTNVRTMDAILREAKTTGQTNYVALDQALVTLYNKLTDPQSVVRESEYARTPENLPLLNRIGGALEKVRRGGAGLTDADREALVWGAKVIANERGRTYSNTLQDYEDLSQRYGMESGLITRGMQPHQAYQFGTDAQQMISQPASQATPQFATEQEALSSGLPAGTVVMVNGRRFQLAE